MNVNEDGTPSVLTVDTPNLSITSIENDTELQAKLKRISDLLPESIKFIEGAKSVLLVSSSMAVYLEKQWKPAQLWLLSNGCLIASRKAKVSLTQGVRHKLTFERFYPVEGLMISAVKDTEDLQNCFKLKTTEIGSVFLHTEEEKDKSNWMQLIQGIIQDYQEQKQKDKDAQSNKHKFKVLSSFFKL